MKSVVRLTGDGDVRLGKAAMQAWSDAGPDGVGGSPLIDLRVDQALQDADSSLVVGVQRRLLKRSRDLGGERTVLVRSTADAAAVRDAVGGERFEVVIGGLDALAGRQFDAVLAPDDLRGTASLEEEEQSWISLLRRLSTLTTERGRLLLGVENEVGLHRLEEGFNLRAANSDADWAPLTTFDSSRPRDSVELEDAVLDAGLRLVALDHLHPAWNSPSVAAADVSSPTVRRLIGLLVMRSESYRQRGQDPNRVALPLAQADRLSEFPAGWMVCAERASVAARSQPVDKGVREHGRFGSFSFHSFTPTEADVVGGGVTTTVELALDARLLSSVLVEACVQGRLPEIRTLLRRYVDWVRSGASTDQPLDPARACSSFDNVVVAGESLGVLTPASGTNNARERIWASLAEFVALLRERGNRHPWPDASSDADLLSLLAAMAGEDPARKVESALVTYRAPVEPLASDHPVVARLQERASALESRARWFETRVSQLETELRGSRDRQAKVIRRQRGEIDACRAELEALQDSREMRLGTSLVKPARRARTLTRSLQERVLGSHRHEG